MGKLDLKIFPYASDGRGLSKPVLDNPTDKSDRIIKYVEMSLGVSNSLELGLSTISKHDYFLFSSASGKIEILVFHFPEMADFKNPRNEPGLHQVIKNLAKEMPETSFLIITDKDEKDRSAVREFLEEENVIICEIVEDKNEGYSVWASDPYKSAYDKNQDYYIVEPYLLIQRTNTNDASVLDPLRVTGGDFVKKSYEKIKYHHKQLKYLDFDGGNILVGNDFVLMGSDIVTYNSNYSDDNIGRAAEEIWRSKNDKDSKYSKLIDEIMSYANGNIILKNKDNVNNTGSIFGYEKFNEIFKRISGNRKKLIKDLLNKFLDKRPIYFIGEKTFDDEIYLNEIHESALRIKGKDQPLFHLDLFITLVGAISNDSYQILVGEPVIGLSDKKLASLDQETLGMIFTQIYRMRHYINTTIEQLKKIDKPKFKIKRIPLPLTYYNFLDKEDDNKLKFKWYWTSYNNCIVEVDEKSKTVWLPSYINDYSIISSDNRLPNFSTDWNNAWNNYYQNNSNEESLKPKYGNWKDLEHYQNEVNEIWTSLGFKVVFIEGDFNWYAQSHGSLACLVNCIKRKI